MNILLVEQKLFHTMDVDINNNKLLNQYTVKTYNHIKLYNCNIYR
jgi:hypothetical protein